jgi:hypothetical protein
MTEDLTTWLVNDVLADAPAGGVGLYEFVWALRGRVGDRDVAELKMTARQALASMLANGDVRLVRQQWSTSAESSVPAGYVVRDEDFDDIPEDGWYIAVTPNP